MFAVKKINLPHSNIENIAGQQQTFIFKIKRLIQGKLCVLSSPMWLKKICHKYPFVVERDEASKTVISFSEHFTKC